MARPVTTDEFASRLRALETRYADPTAGFFGPESMTWRINRDPVIYLAGIRALLMQVAHPKIAQGVSDHSNYREDPFGRLWRTFDTVHALVFGTAETATHAASRLHAVHARINGSIPDPVPWPHTARYAANDPDLLFWVYATLIDSALFAARLFLPELSEEDAAQFYEESKVFAGLCAVPADRLPDTLGDFRAHTRDLISGPSLCVGDTARDIAGSILKGPAIMTPLRPSNYVLAAGSLPAPLRDAFGLGWSSATRVSYLVGVLAVRTFVRNVPLSVRSLPVARRAERRVEARDSAQAA